MPAFSMFQIAFLLLTSWLLFGGLSRNRVGRFATHLKVTTNVYTHAVGPQKREAQSNLVRLVKKECDSRQHAKRTGSSWIMKESGEHAEAVYFGWRPRRDLNPCYRRERDTSICK